MFKQEKIWLDAIDYVNNHKDFKKMKPSSYFKITVDFVLDNFHKNILKDYDYYLEFKKIIE
jgi:hypothetical protein